MARPSHRGCASCSGCRRDSGLIHEHEHTPGFRVDVVVDAPCARDTGPSGAESSTSVYDLALEDEEGLPLRSVRRPVRPRLPSR
jgi:hypothetical protein